MKALRQLSRQVAPPILLVATVLLAACGKSVSTPSDTGNSVAGQEIIDGAGRMVMLSAVPQRIVSLSPAATDILVAEGAHAQIAGATRYCNIPEGDEKRVVRIGGVLDPDYERILTLKPDLVVVPWLADKSLLEKLVALGLPVLVLHSEGLQGVMDDMRMIGAATGHAVEGEKKTRAIEAIRSLALSRWKDVPVEKHPWVLIYMDEESPAPGSYVDDVLMAAGGRNVLPQSSKSWLEVPPERALQLAPDIIIEIPSTDQPTNPGANQFTANSTRIVKLTDGEIFYHPGPDLGRALWNLARAIDPARFPEATPPISP